MLRRLLAPKIGRIDCWLRERLALDPCLVGVISALRIGSHENRNILLLVHLSIMKLNFLVWTKVARNNCHIVYGCRRVESWVLLVLLGHHWPFTIYCLELMISKISTRVEVLMRARGSLHRSARVFCRQISFRSALSNIKAFSSWRMTHLLSWLSICLAFPLSSLPCKLERIIVECISSYRIQIDTLGFSFL